jgi:hypothetical protein
MGCMINIIMSNVHINVLHALYCMYCIYCFVCIACIACIVAAAVSNPEEINLDDDDVDVGGI